MKNIKRSLCALACLSALAIIPNVFATEKVSSDFGVKKVEAASALLSSFREILVDDVVHYTFEFPVGNGPHDVIKLHRVVRERAPYLPKKMKKNVFFLHGDAISFETKFLYGSRTDAVSEEQSVAVFLAQNNVDVWGIDQPWMQVPEDTADFSFMADWGLQYAIDSLKTGLEVARLTRLLTGSGIGKMNLLGYSSGVPTAYAYLAQEAQLPSWKRNVKGFIVADGVIHMEPEYQPGYCDYAWFYQDLYDQGVYEDTFGAYFIFLGQMAQEDPYGMSPDPDWEGFTNLQAAIGFGSYQDPSFGKQLLAGTFDEDFLPTGLQYTSVDGWLDFMANAKPYGPTKFVTEYFMLGCGDVDLPFDDHLSDIEVPLFYLGAAGGEGEAGLYSTTLVGSQDVSSFIVSLHPEEEAYLDFGHIDLWTADNAMELAWEPLLEWIVTHSRRHHVPLESMEMALFQ